MILLTKKINNELDALGLQELTVVRTEDSALSLVGRECAKQILKFSSMPISKKLTVVERDILTDDYIMPIITKYAKDLTTLITLMKDKTIDDMVQKAKDDAFEHDNLALSVSTSYSTALGRQATSYYQARTTDADKHTDESGVRYNVAEEKYIVDLNISQSDPKFCVNELNTLDVKVAHMLYTLGKWKDMNEALAVKNDHVKELQEKMQTKCSL